MARSTTSGDPERAGLIEFLDYQRESLIAKSRASLKPKQG